MSGSHGSRYYIALTRNTSIFCHRERKRGDLMSDPVIASGSAAIRFYLMPAIPCPVTLFICRIIVPRALIQGRQFQLVKSTLSTQEYKRVFRPLGIL